jgi:hypothetical protein
MFQETVAFYRENQIKYIYTLRWWNLDLLKLVAHIVTTVLWRYKLIWTAHKNAYDCKKQWMRSGCIAKRLVLNSLWRLYLQHANSGVAALNPVWACPQFSVLLCESRDLTKGDPH